MTSAAQLFEHIVNIRKQYVALMNKRLSKFQLSTSQWLVFKIIVQSRPESITLVEIAKIRNIEKPTATKIIQYLLEQQLIETHTGKDKREKRLFATQHGRNVYDQVMTMIQSTQDALTPMDIELITQTNEQLTQVYQALQSIQEKED
ncbi:MarR family winged helix-turn-helix transcriptional regulator [Macrococcus sp. DPC7161]|uniref:MarR family winged helix-turn-helix transcriptional regulator n=1 Tax=Macrococcus sp. DPC7161 TaxID=2507060 RepID=UPI0013E91A80|nr:MarR family transcriptional regulator [Macrococcus sp. DPC7161]